MSNFAVLMVSSERVLALTEKPANIVRRRLEQAGYDEADGLESLGADDLAFLMKFEYKSNVLGPLVRLWSSSLHYIRSSIVAG